MPAPLTATLVDCDAVVDGVGEALGDGLPNGDVEPDGDTETLLVAVADGEPLAD